MEDVKAMLKGRILLPRNLNEIFNERVLGDSKWLCDDDVIPIIEERECKLNEIETSRLIDFINTKQIDDNSISSLIWDLG
jgi:hypothetical protein